jgi:hypothetical protein
MQYLHVQTQSDARLPSVGHMLHQLMQQYGSRAIEINWIQQDRLLATIKLDDPWLLLHPEATAQDIDSGEAVLSTGHTNTILASLQTVICDVALGAYAYADYYQRMREQGVFAKSGLEAARHQRYRFVRLPHIKLQELGEPALALLTWLCGLAPQYSVSWEEMLRVSQLDQDSLGPLLHALLICGCLKTVSDHSFQIRASAPASNWTHSMLQWLRQPSSQF